MNEWNRRQILTLLSVGAGCVLPSCGSATPASALDTPDPSTTPAVPTPAPTATLGTPTMAAGQALLNIPANPTFTFSKAQDNTGTGETSPIPAAYWLGHYLVTNAQYLTFTQATGQSIPGYWTGGLYPDGKDNRPVLSISLTDARAYCAWLNGEQQTFTFRLPSEAEWENAAKGPAHFTYPWGNAMDATYTGGTLDSPFNHNAVCAALYLQSPADVLATYTNPNSTRYGQSEALSSILSVSATGTVSGWIDHATSPGFVYTDLFDELMTRGGLTSAVGAYPAGLSAYGCLDMAGNAYEWTDSLVTAANGAEAGQRVNAVRSGSWYATGRSGQAVNCGEERSASGSYATVGFRRAASPTAS